MHSHRNDQSELEKLPIETLVEIFSYLSPEDVAAPNLVSKQFHIAANDNVFWEKKFKKHFPHVFKSPQSQTVINWYAEFRKTYDDEYEYLHVNVRKWFSSVKEEDVNGLIFLKLRHLDIDDKKGRGLLGWARKKNIKTVLDYFYQLAVDEYLDGITVNTTKRDDLGRTILHWAIKCYQAPDLIALLIFQGADIHARCKNGFDAFRLAAAVGHAEIIELLIMQYNADINNRSSNGATALLLAIVNGHKNVVDVLLKYNADITIPLHMNSSYYQRVNVLAGDTPLHAAIKLGHVDIFQDLVIKGADINIRVNGYNALHLATQKGQAEIIELLITQYNAGINDRSWAGATALLFAIENSHKNVVDVLLKHDADITIPLQTNYTYHEKFNVVAGDTPLHVASRLGEVAIVQVLINKNADIEAVNSQGQKPADVAKKDSRYGSELKLLTYIAKVNRLPDNHYKNSFSFFNGSVNLSLGCSSTEKKAAAKALGKVVFFNNDDAAKIYKYKAKLKEENIAKALDNGELGVIYRSLCG